MRGARIDIRVLLLVAVRIAVCAVFLLPVLWMVLISLQPAGTGLAAGPAELLRGRAFENYTVAIERMGDFPRLFANTMFITVCCVIGQMFVASAAGYAFACMRFRGRDALFLVVMATMMLPDQVTAIPRFLEFRELGLVDTFWPLILPMVFGGAPFWPPFFIFLFRQYYKSLPGELVEAARVDGCGHVVIWWRVMLPLSRPMLATVAVFTYLAVWNDLWTPLIYIMSNENQTLTLALAGFNRTYNTAVEHMMAATTVVLLPCVLVYTVAQGIFSRGIRTSALKS